MGLAFKLRKLVGKDRDKWPVTVDIYTKQGNSLKKKRDRGRRTIDEDDGATYQLMRQGHETAAIPQKYFEQDQSGHPKLNLLMVQTQVGPEYYPMEREISFETGDIDKNEEQSILDWLGEQDENASLEDFDVGIKFLLNHARSIQVGKNELERHYEITKDENSQWYKAPIVWLVGGAIGMGIFFVLAGIGAQKALTPAAEASSSIVPLLALKTREKLESKK